MSCRGWTGAVACVLALVLNLLARDWPHLLVTAAMLAAGIAALAAGE